MERNGEQDGRLSPFRYDLIMVAASRDAILQRITQTAIDSCRKEGNVNVILIETFQRTNYRGVDLLIEYKGMFNYNRALNMGIREAKGDIFILANNDLIFLPGWSTIGYTMRDNGYLSACALSNDPRQRAYPEGDHCFENYVVGHGMAGWCIFADHNLFTKIGELDESYVFWWSDNAYADQLIGNGIKHALICNVRVNHLVSYTLNRVSRRERKEYTRMIYAKRKEILKINPKNIQT